MTSQQLKESFCIYSENISPKGSNIGFDLGKSVKSLEKQKEYGGIRVFLSGFISNLDEIKNHFEIGGEDAEEIIAQFYFKVRYEIPKWLEGCYSMVIDDGDNLIVFRDIWSVENIYYNINKNENLFIVSNSIKNIKNFLNLQVNTDILPKYFIYATIGGNQTLFKDISTLKMGEILLYNKETKKWVSDIYNNFAYQAMGDKKLSNDQIIEKTEHFLRNDIAKICRVYPPYHLVSSFTGGVDSSFIAIIMKDLGFNKAYTACYSYPQGEICRKHAKDVADFLNLSHNIITITPSNMVKGMKEGINYTELPLMFEAECMIHTMADTIRSIEQVESKNIGLVFGHGSDAFQAKGKALKIIKYTTKPGVLFLFNAINKFIIKFISKDIYKKCKTIINGIKRNEVDKDLFFEFFVNGNLLKVIKQGFYPTDISNIFNHEIRQMQMYNVPLIEKIYRTRIFDYEITRGSNMLYQISKNHGIYSFFPYLNKSLVDLYLNIPTSRKVTLRILTIKPFIKKVLRKYLPYRLVYKKKISQNPEYSNIIDILLKDEEGKKIIEEIKNTEYPYFNFNLDEIFSKKEYSDLAFKIINFHIWHSLFIAPNSTQFGSTPKKQS